MKRNTLLALATVVAVLAALVAASISTAAPAGAASFTLYAGKTTPVGTVYVWNDATNLYVEIDMDSGWCMTESHVAAASTLAGIPQVNGNPPPGQFPYGDTYSPCEAGGDTFTIPLVGLSSNPFVAVHAQVLHQTSMWVYSDDGNTTITATSALPAGKVLPFASTDAWEPYSDTDPSVWDNGVGVGTFQHADWIWQSYRVQTPGIDETVSFQRTFTVPGPVAPGSWMKVTTDDAFTASLNGAQVASGTWPNWPTVQTASPFAPIRGGNTLAFVATNSSLSGGTGGTIDSNPGGLIYEAVVNYYDRSESAWAGTNAFPGKNWATYFRYTAVDWADSNGSWVYYNIGGLNRQAKFTFGATGGDFWYDDTTGTQAYHVTLTQGAFSANTAYACGTVDGGAFIGSKLLLKVADGDLEATPTVDVVWGDFVSDPCTNLGFVTPGSTANITSGEINVLNVP